MRVRVNPARNDELSRRVDGQIGFHIQCFSDNRNRLVFD
jgi:hypothetical protein